MKKFLFALIIMFIPTLVYAADSSKFTISCDNTKLDVKDQVVCRTSVDTDFNYNEIVFNMGITDGLDVVDVRSNYDAIWSLKDKNGVVTAKSSNNAVQNGLQEFGIFLFKALKSGKQTITFSNIVLKDGKSTKKIDDVSVDIKVVSSDNTLKAININDKLIDGYVSFDTLYTVNLTNEKKIKIEGVPTNQYAKIVGNGEFTLDDKNNNYIFPLTVTSEDGINRTYIINLTRSSIKDDLIDKTLKSLTINNQDGNNVSFDFTPDVNSYDIDLASTDTSVDIIPELNNNQTTFVKNYGKQSLKLSEGDNVVLIEIVDSNGQIKTYILNLTKPLSNKSDDSFLSTLLIEGYKFSFSKRVRNYTLEINKGTKKLDIKAETENVNANYEIVGNDDLQDGSVVKIIVTAENESKTIYNINIKVKPFNYTLVVITALIASFITTMVIMKKKDHKAKQSNVVTIPKEMVIPDDNKKKEVPVVNKKENKKPKQNKTQTHKVQQNNVKSNVKTHSKKNSNKRRKTKKKTKKSSKKI